MNPRKPNPALPNSGNGGVRAGRGALGARPGAVAGPARPSAAQQLDQLADAIEKFKIDFERFLAGATLIPPEEQRMKLVRDLRELRGANLRASAEQFRLASLEARFNSYTELFNRRLRDREEGRGVRHAAPSAPCGRRASPARRRDRRRRDRSARARRRRSALSGPRPPQRLGRIAGDGAGGFSRLSGATDRIDPAQDRVRCGAVPHRHRGRQAQTEGQAGQPVDGRFPAPPASRKDSHLRKLIHPVAALLAGAALSAALSAALLHAAVPRNIDRAIETQRALVAERPADSGVENDLGSLLVLGEDFAGAEQAYRRAIELDPENASAHFNLGLLLQQMGNRRDALKAYKRTVELEPRHAWAHYQKGTIYHAQGRDSAAKKAYAKALAFDPALGNPEVNPHLIDNDLATSAMLYSYRHYREELLPAKEFEEPARIAGVLIDRPAGEEAKARQPPRAPPGRREGGFVRGSGASPESAAAARRRGGCGGCGGRRVRPGRRCDDAARPRGAPGARPHQQGPRPVEHRQPDRRRRRGRRLGRQQAAGGRITSTNRGRTRDAQPTPTRPTLRGPQQRLDLPASAAAGRLPADQRKHRQDRNPPGRDRRVSCAAAAEPAGPLDVEAEVDDVAVGDDVLLAFEAQQALVAAVGERLELEEVLAGDDFGADEAALDVGVDGAGGLLGVGAAADRPGAHLVLADGEEGDQAEQLVARAQHAVERRLGEAEVAEELLLLGGGEARDLLLDRRRDDDRRMLRRRRYRNPSASPSRPRLRRR